MGNGAGIVGAAPTQRFDTGLVTFNSSGAICGPVKATSGYLHMYVNPNASDPITLQESPNNSDWYDCLDTVNGDGTTGKYTTETSVLPVLTVPGSWYRLAALAADYGSGATGTGRLWG